MGKIVSRLTSKEAHEVFLDLENAQPTNKEESTYNMIQSLLEKSQTIMKTLSDYKGCSDLARKAMGSPSPENEKNFFEGLLTSVDNISQFFEFSKELEAALPQLLLVLASPSTEVEAKQTIQDQQALARQLCEVFDFTLRFDQTRMERPFLSNDFSYYRRLLPKFSKHPDVKVNDDDSSGMALFTAEHIPMMTALARAGGKALEKNVQVTNALAIMANSCCKIIKTKKYAQAETGLLAARAMTAAIVLFDHVNPRGAFGKGSPIAIKTCVNVLKKEFPREQALMNAIQYSCKNFQSAPSDIKQLFN